MKDWFDYTIEERIKINNEQGFTVNNVFPKGTESRKRFDKMIEETMKNLDQYYAKKKLKAMDLSPEELLNKEKK